MANKTVPEIILAIRQLSNTVRRQVVTDAEVLARANEGLQNLYDLVDGAHGTFFVTPHPFTLVGGYGQNVAELPDDFYHAKALDRLLGASPGPRMSVPAAPSYAERNNLSRRFYDIVAGNVVVSPPTLSAGNYELQYIPKCAVLADRLTYTVAYAATPITATPGSDAVDGTLKSWFFPAGAFDSSYLLGYLNILGAANAANNGHHIITAVDDPQTLRTASSTPLSELFGPGVTASVYLQPLDKIEPGGGGSTLTCAAVDFSLTQVGYTIEVSGSESSDGTYTIRSIIDANTVQVEEIVFSTEYFLPGVTVAIQPAGTVYSVPGTLNDWVLYAELDAAVSILDKQSLDSAPIQGRRALQAARIQAAARARRDQPYQVPMRRRGGWRGGFC